MHVHHMIRKTKSNVWLWGPGTTREFSGTYRRVRVGKRKENLSATLAPASKCHLLESYDELKFLNSAKKNATLAGFEPTLPKEQDF